MDLIKFIFQKRIQKAKHLLNKLQSSNKSSHCSAHLKIFLKDIIESPIGIDKKGFKFAEDFVKKYY